MKTFAYSALPAGCLTNSKTLKNLINSGAIKFFWGEDDGAIIEELLPYLESDNEIFIHSERGFIWWGTQDSSFKMSDRRISLVFYTDDDGMEFED